MWTGFGGTARPPPQARSPGDPPARGPPTARSPTSMYAVSLFASLMCGNQSRGGLDRCFDSVTNHSSFGHPWRQDTARSGIRHPDSRCAAPVPFLRPAAWQHKPRAPWRPQRVITGYTRPHGRRQVTCHASKSVSRTRGDAGASRVQSPQRGAGSHLPLNCGISPVGLFGSPLWQASLVKATVTPQLPSKNPICWLPASWGSDRDMGHRAGEDRRGPGRTVASLAERVLALDSGAEGTSRG